MYTAGRAHIIVVYAATRWRLILAYKRVSFATNANTEPDPYF